MRGWLSSFVVLMLVRHFCLAAEPAATPKSKYIKAVTRGAGLMPGQSAGASAQERAFREQIEQRKSDLLEARVPLKHPVMMTPEAMERARRNIASADWAKMWADRNREIADYVAGQPADYVERMIPELTPTNTYGFTCPHCVGKKSQEGTGSSLMGWDYRKPDVCTCRRCGQVYPSDAYPEDAKLVCPRSGQTFTFYLNERERAEPDNRTGELAYHWVGRPIHVSFSGNIRAAKIDFMTGAAKALALQYAFSGEPRYALRAREILVRFAQCYRNWLYHDYWDAFADCDPMYAAWHDRQLALEWKRHLCEQAFAKDSEASAAMLQSYWGAGRIHCSTDGHAAWQRVALAYDLIHDAADPAGKPIWSKVDREKVERDLLLEYVMGAEPFIGGAGKAETFNNKTPRIYLGLAYVGRALGLAGYVDVALRGYEGVRDESFLYDGFSKESPSYTNMYLSELVQIPELLQGFTWPAGVAGRQGTVDLFATDSRLRAMFRALRDQLRPDGRYAPLSDTNVAARPATHLIEMGLKRYPEYFRGTMPSLRGSPGEYALFQLTPEEMALDTGLPLPEVYFPAWMTAMLRHGDGPNAAMLVMSLNPPGGHRHADNLALFYCDGGEAILGDHGYLGDMPQNAWIKSTLSHNLVIVDDAEQQSKERHPRFERMFTSDRVSVIEAGSDGYSQCGEYSRLAALAKGPEGRTFAVDIFRAKGGRKHDYRVFSELAASDARGGQLEFRGLKMPAEAALPKVGASLARADIFGLRDVRAVSRPVDSWQAVWKQKGRQYRLWMLGAVDRVEASNGPGQETLSQPGRRVRYVDAVREGNDLASTFVAVHEPSGLKGEMPIRSVRLLDVPAEAGRDAVALRVESEWGTYVVLNRFDKAAEVDGVRFQGQLAVLHEQSGHQWLAAQESSVFNNGRIAFENATPVWSGKVVGQGESAIDAESPAPVDMCERWRANRMSSEFTSYVVIRTASGQTAFPVAGLGEKRIEVERFSLPASVNEFRLANLVVLEK